MSFSLRELWQRIPETVRVLAILALLVDVFGLPSGVVALHWHAAHWVMPWTAWGLILTTASVQKTYGLLALALLGGAIYWGTTLQHGEGQGGTAAREAFGSARWLSPREIAQSFQRWHAEAPTNPAGLVAGAVQARGPVRDAWVLGKDGHNILLGAPGAGKSLRVILPSLAVIAESGENLVVTDPKGELKEAVGGYLAHQGYRVITLDLRNPAQSVRWNPLQPISQAIQEHRWSDADKAANDLATLLAAQGAPGGENNQFFLQSSRMIGAALALLVADQAPPEARHLASVYHVLTQHAADLEGLIQALPIAHPARRVYGPMRTGSPETRQNQMSVVAVSLSLFADTNIAWLTGANEFDPAMLVQPKTAVFIVVPDDTTTYYPLAALFVTQILQALAQAASQRSGRQLAVPVHMVLDEFGNFPRIPDFEQAIGVARGRGIRITLTLQALSQLDDRYGATTANTMRNSCNTWVYLSANDPETARLVSDKVGQTTIETTSRGQNWQTGSRQYSENTNTTGRALLAPDEVLRWHPDHTLVLRAGQLPAKLPARFWPDWPQAAQIQQAGWSLPESQGATMDFPMVWTPEVVLEDLPWTPSIDPTPPVPDPTPSEADPWAPEAPLDSTPWRPPSVGHRAL